MSAVAPEVEPGVLAWDRELLKAAGLFDAEYYVRQAGEAAEADPIGHYLAEGWRFGMEPNAAFPGTLLHSYFATAGHLGPPAITYLILTAAGWSIPADRPTLADLVQRLRASSLVDEVAYARRAGLGGTGLDPVAHYLMIGEHQRVPPSAAFDPSYYAERHPDVGGTRLLLHYLTYGRREGRRGIPIVQPAGERDRDPAKDDVLLVIHETSRTGAPILGWNLLQRLAAKYNVSTLSLGSGELTDDFLAISTAVYGPFDGPDRTRADIEHSIGPMLERKRFRFAIVNSAESRIVLETMARRFVPTVFLVHEFASYVHFAPPLSESVDWATEIVFPARVVAEAAQDACPALRTRSFSILPQGASSVPGPRVGLSDAAASVLDRLGQERERDGAFVVLGAGTVFIRKGVDFFLAAAAAARRHDPEDKLRFLWVGSGYRPDSDMSYSVYLREQIRRSGLDAYVTILDEVTDLEPVYALADAFLLTSRLDPLPNVSIDAACRGVPIVCFREASGMAELLLRDDDTAEGVVDYLDADAAGRAVARLAMDETMHARVAAATLRLGRNVFDMDTYAEALDRLGNAAALRTTQQQRDATDLLSDDAFDQDMFLGPRPIVESRRCSVVRYLCTAAARGMGEPARPDVSLRRPSPGFNPRIYAAHHPELAAQLIDPTADYVRRGRPGGPWQVPVIRPDAPDFLSTGSLDAAASTLRVAVQAHVFYVDLACDIARRLRANQTRIDLLVSTDTEQKAAALREAFAGCGTGRGDIRVFPNRGRNIGPLLTGFAADLHRYDVVGHVHAKRSRFTGSDAMGDLWREFLWQNLIGGLHPMMDAIVARFAREPSTGLVFPSDPHLFGWGGNRSAAEELAERMHFSEALPDAFDFPVGGMFWARPAALRPLLDLRLDWNDYPDEPLSIDGTLLHAVERLPVQAARQAGFGYAVTHVPGLSWAP